LAKKVHKLILDEPNDVLLLGIVSNENDYRLSWQINKYLNISLMRSKDIEIDMKKSLQSFTQYIYSDDERYLQFHFIKNKSNQQSYLIPEQKSCDFLLCIQGSLSIDEYEILVQKVKQIPNVSMAIKIDMNELKSKKNLAFL
jgi:hypothetical protein